MAEVDWEFVMHFAQRAVCVVHFLVEPDGRLLGVYFLHVSCAPTGMAFYEVFASSKPKICAMKSSAISSYISIPAVRTISIVLPLDGPASENERLLHNPALFADCTAT